MRRAVSIAAVVGGIVFAWSVGRHVLQARDLSDVAPLLVSSRALLEGRDAYAVTGPGASFDYPWRQYYPATALVTLLPLARLPLSIADSLFVALSAAWFAFAIVRAGYPWPPILLSGALMWALDFRQWSPALVAASLTPALAGILAAKPTTGLALVAGARSWRTVAGAALGGAALTAVAFVLMPDWPLRWLGTFKGQDLHFVAPITRLPFGPLALLALLRWRRPEARLIVALACVPQTNSVCDALPLLLVAASFGEALLLAVTTHLVGAIQFTLYLGIPMTEASARSASWLAAVVYLPCVGMVLRRPNTVPDSAPASSPPRDAPQLTTSSTIGPAERTSAGAVIRSAPTSVSNS